MLLAALSIGIQIPDSDDMFHESSAATIQSKISGTSIRAATALDDPIRSPKHELPESRKHRIPGTSSNKYSIASTNLNPGISKTSVSPDPPEIPHRDSKAVLWLDLPPESPGQQLASGNRRCEVIAYQVADAAQTANWIVKISDNESSEPAPIPARTDREFKFGFTREEELFRMKWGWIAFDQVQKDLQSPR